MELSMKENHSSTELLPKAIQKYLKKFGDSELTIFNVHLQDKYESLEKLCEECLKQNKTIRELEPARSKIET